MRSRLLVKKLYVENITTTKFIEKYYSDRVGYPIHIKLDDYCNTSYFDKPNIVISVKNLEDFANYNEKLFRPLFYTLLLHEIGHAIYTDSLPYSMAANVLEDNRLEYQISTWNARVQFRLMRFIYQDERLKDIDHELLLTDETAIALALMRTVDNSRFVQALGFTMERKAIIKEILKLNDIYMKKDYELLYCPSIHLSELRGIIQKVEDLIKRLVDIAEQEKKQQQQQQQQQGGSNNQQDDTQDDTEEETQDDTEEETTQGQGGVLGGDDIQEQLSHAIQEAERMLQDENYNVPVLFNDQPDTTDYTQYKIGLFDSSRHSGIKGKSSMQTSRGNIKQLNMQRYMRRHIVNGEKLFDRVSEIGVGGKNAKVCFYLDISGSMDSSSKIRIATDYLKSFYDTMHTHIDIRMYGFGSHTYKITRNELNLSFLRERLEGSTHLYEVKHKPNEYVVVITDGAIDNQLSDKMKRTAQFVLIGDERYNSKQVQFIQDAAKEFVHKTYVDPKDLVKGLDKATKGIRELLLK